MTNKRGWVELIEGFILVVLSCVALDEIKSDEKQYDFKAHQ